MNVSQYLAAIEDAKARVQAHPMCARFHDDGERFVVYYPPGMIIDGARASYAAGKLIALERLLVVMERHWAES
jgi:hypothetical protein